MGPPLASMGMPNWTETSSTSVNGASVVFKTSTVEWMVCCCSRRLSQFCIRLFERPVTSSWFLANFQNDDVNISHNMWNQTHTHIQLNIQENDIKKNLRMKHSHGNKPCNLIHEKGWLLTLSSSLKVSSTSFTKALHDSSALNKELCSSSVNDPPPNDSNEE